MPRYQVSLTSRATRYYKSTTYHAPSFDAAQAKARDFAARHIGTDTAALLQDWGMVTAHSGYTWTPGHTYQLNLSLAD